MNKTERQNGVVHLLRIRKKMTAKELVILLKIINPIGIQMLIFGLEQPPFQNME